MTQKFSTIIIKLILFLFCSREKPFGLIVAPDTFFSAQGSMFWDDGVSIGMCYFLGNLLTHLVFTSGYCVTMFANYFALLGSIDNNEYNIYTFGMTVAVSGAHFCLNQKLIHLIT